MKKTLGNKIFIGIIEDGKFRALAGSRTSSLDLKMNTIEVADKNSGTSKSFIADREEWDLKQQMFYTAEFPTLFEMFKARKPVTVAWYDTDPDSTTGYLYGLALLTNIKKQADINSLTTCSISFKGVSAITSPDSKEYPVLYEAWDGGNITIFNAEPFIGNVVLRDAQSKEIIATFNGDTIHHIVIQSRQSPELSRGKLIVTPATPQVVVTQKTANTYEFYCNPHWEDITISASGENIVTIKKGQTTITYKGTAVTHVKDLGFECDGHLGHVLSDQNGINRQAWVEYDDDHGIFRVKLDNLYPLLYDINIGLTNFAGDETYIVGPEDNTGDIQYELPWTPEIEYIFDETGIYNFEVTQSKPMPANHLYWWKLWKDIEEYSLFRTDNSILDLDAHGFYGDHMFYQNDVVAQFFGEDEQGESQKTPLSFIHNGIKSANIEQIYTPSIDMLCLEISKHRFDANHIDIMFTWHGPSIYSLYKDIILVVSRPGVPDQESPFAKHFPVYRDRLTSEYAYNPTDDSEDIRQWRISFKDSHGNIVHPNFIVKTDTTILYS